MILLQVQKTDKELMGPIWENGIRVPHAVGATGN